MNKFEQLLNANAETIKSKRSEILMADAKDAQDEILRNLRKEKRDLEKELISLTDIYPNSTLSLEVVKPDFNAAELFEDIQSIKLQILEKDVEIKAAEETYNEWFDDKE